MVHDHLSCPAWEFLKQAEITLDLLTLNSTRRDVICAGKNMKQA